jgi:hypothetical protein
MKLRELVRNFLHTINPKRVFGETVRRTDPVQLLAVGMRQCAEEMAVTATQVAILEHNVTVHNHAINVLLDRQRALFSLLTERSMDMSMPDLNEAKVDPKDEAAKAKAAAASKPN